MNLLLFIFWLFNLSRNFIGAILVVYLVSKGIGIHIIAIAKSAQLILSVIANIPAGKIAEKYGNKVSIVISCLCAMTYFLLLLSPTEEKVILAEIFNGLSIAFYVGAAESWLLQFKSSTHNAYSIFSRKTEIVLIATIIASAVSSLIINYSMWISLFFMTCTLICILCVSEKKSPIEQSDSHSNRNIDIRIPIFLYEKKFIVLPLVLMLGSTQLLYQFWPVYFQHDPIHTPEYLIGSAFGFCLFIQFVVQVIVRKNISHKKNVNIYLNVICLAMITTLFMLLESNPSKNIQISIGCIILYAVFSALCSVLTNFLFSELSDSFDSNQKSSTIISTIDASGRCLGACFLLVIYLLEIQSIHLIWSFIPATLCITLVLFLTKNHMQREAEKKHGIYKKI